jgi:hypothetical protein
MDAAPPPPTPPAVVTPRPAAAPHAPPPTPAAIPSPPTPPVSTPPAPPTPPVGSFGPVAVARPALAAPLPPGVAEYWLPMNPSGQDMTLKLQALTGLLDTHSTEVIPLLRQIALDRNSPDEARQAVFVLGQSRQPEAQRTVLEVARQGAEPVRIAAVRQLARFDGPAVSTELMQVYSMPGTPRLKRQVVTSLAERADSASLLRIAKSETEPTVRDFAIVTLGRTGARDQLRTLYVQAPHESRPAVLTALFAAKDDDELIRIAKTESNPALRLRARQQLRLLATPKAIKFLEENP